MNGQSNSKNNLARLVMYNDNFAYKFLTFLWTISALVAALHSAVQDARDNRFVPPDVAHERIRTMYTWENVARRTEKVSLTYRQIWLLSLRSIHSPPVKDWTRWHSSVEIRDVTGCWLRAKIQIIKQPIGEHVSIFGSLLLFIDLKLIKVN